MELIDCPPGFKLKDHSECVCNVDAYEGLFKCDLDNSTVIYSLPWILGWPN